MLYLVCMILEGSLLYQSFNADDVREERCMKDKHYDLKTPLLCRCGSILQTHLFPSTSHRWSPSQASRK
jgi:hypothetical protein